MKDIDEITDALAKRYAGNLLDDDKPKEVAKPVREYTTGRDTEITYESSGYSQAPSYASGGKLFPMDRMALRDYSKPNAKATPTRGQVLISVFSDDELEFMFSTPVKRGWMFEDWLEVIGLPRDLHEKHDASIYGFAARAFLKRKSEAHLSK